MLAKIKNPVENGVLEIDPEKAVKLAESGYGEVDHVAIFDEAQALVAKLQAHITANYYTCTDEILAGLGKMYVCDERFKKNIDKYGDGTAEFAAEGIRIYVENK